MLHIYIYIYAIYKIVNFLVMIPLNTTSSFWGLYKEHLLVYWFANKYKNHCLKEGAVLEELS